MVALWFPFESRPKGYPQKSDGHKTRYLGLVGVQIGSATSLSVSIDYRNPMSTGINHTWCRILSMHNITMCRFTSTFGGVTEEGPESYEMCLLLAQAKPYLFERKKTP